MDHYPRPAIERQLNAEAACCSQQPGVFPEQYSGSDANGQLTFILKALLESASPEVRALLAGHGNVVNIESKSAPGGGGTNQDQVAPLSPHGPVLGMKPAARYAGMSVSMLYELLKKGGPRYDPTFPIAFSITERRRVIAVAGLDAWLASKSARAAEGS